MNSLPAVRSREAGIHPGASWDVLIVGSGAGGAATAYRLAHAGRRVLLLEKGSSLPTDGSTLDVERVVRRGEFLSHEPWLDGSGRRFAPEEHFNVGGKTKWYGAALFRFARREFEADPSMGYLGWPIGYATLEPWYQEAETLLGVREIPIEPDLQRILRRLTSGPAGWRADPMPMGLAGTITLYPDEARHFDGFASVRGLKGEAEDSLLRPLLAAGQVSLLCDAEVVALLGAAGNPVEVSGVRLRDGREFHGRHVVLAAGALHSPRLLQRYLASSGLDRQLPIAPHVGAHLKLHLLTAMVAMSASRKTDLVRKTTVLTNPRFPHSSVQPLGFDGELIAGLVPPFVPRPIARALGVRAYGFFLQTEDSSDPRNRVLDRGLREPSLPELDYDAARGARAEREHRAFSWALQRALLAAGLVSFRQRIGLAGTAHACGTMVCGKSPASSVVDADGQVHGMARLHVADGSVLARSSRVNPSLTIYAWGLRLGERISRLLDSGAGAVAGAPVSAPQASHAS